MALCSFASIQYDRTVNDILPFHALTPATFQQRHNDLKNGNFMYNLTITPSGVIIGGDRATSSRPISMKTLIEGFLGYLPEGFELEFTGSDHDLGSQVLGADQRARAMELAVKGERECRGCRGRRGRVRGAGMLLILYRLHG